jgi:prepilin-type N-terminal cleavage/methylation domain-containing protein
MFKSKLPKQNQGFTLVEVLVAILITTIFVSVAMQAMAIAAFFKVKAQEYAEATTWIQEDLEQAKYQAANYQYTSLTSTIVNPIGVAATDSFAVNDRLRISSDSSTYTVNGKNSLTLTITPTLGIPQLNAVVTGINRCKNSVLSANAAANVSSINVASAGSFAANDQIKVGSDTGTYTISTISGTTLNLTPNLGTNQGAGAVVVIAATNSNKGFADGLRDWITGTDITSNSNSIDISKTSNRTSKPFVMRRTTTISSTPPYAVLEVKYEVSSGTTFNSSNIIADSYTEIIPNAALQCPY